MAEITRINTKARRQINNCFPLLDSHEIPHIYEIRTIDYEKDRINEYHTIFWHRLLKEIYQKPTEMECELLTRNHISEKSETAILRRQEKESKWNVLGTSEENILRIQAGELKPWPTSWRYFFRLRSGGIVVIGSRDTLQKIYFALASEAARFSDEDQGEAEKFISLLIVEAEKSRNQLFEPQKMFKEAAGVKSYLLINVYLSNYASAQFMLKTAIIEEDNLRREFVRLNQQRQDLKQDGIERLDQCTLAMGMYFSSAITHFYMAFEGFINILYHAFLKKNLRESDLHIDARLDIEQKFSLLPALCDGFQHEQFNLSSDLRSKFKGLTKYRNSIFHSKIEDSLKSLVFLEDGFLYQYFLDKDNYQMFSSLKAQLTVDNVIQVQRIVDELVRFVVESMKEEIKTLAEGHILKSPAIPFSVLSDGSILLGLGTNNDKQTEEQ